MAKPTKMAADAAADSQAADQIERPYVKGQDFWDQVEGAEFGGNNPILALEAGECAGPLTYMGHQEINTELGTTTAHSASDEDGAVWRLPIQATFLRAVDQAALRRGDVFAVRRGDDINKKRGKGAGKPMAIYALKVLERSANPVTA